MSDHFSGEISAHEAVHFIEDQNDVKYDWAVQFPPRFENLDGVVEDWMKIGSEDAINFLQYLESKGKKDRKDSCPRSMRDIPGVPPFRFELTLWYDEFSETILDGGGSEDRGSLKYAVIIYGSGDKLGHEGPVPLYSLSGYESESLEYSEAEKRIESYLENLEVV